LPGLLALPETTAGTHTGFLYPAYLGLTLAGSKVKKDELPGPCGNLLLTNNADIVVADSCIKLRTLHSCGHRVTLA